MAATKRRLSDSEHEERRRRDRERLADATRALLSSDGWKAWLRARATLHSYSLHNTLLLAQEARRRGFTPTHVAGLKAWLRLGRCVRKGERGLPILAPIRVKPRDGRDEQDRGRLFFRTVHVWDVSQTDPLPGQEPAPLAPPRAPVEGDSYAHLLAPLEALAGELDYTVTYRQLELLDGRCNYRQPRIAVADRLTPNGQAAVLVHELGHALLDRARGGLDRKLEELVVEAVAYIVCAGAGLDTTPDSVPYIASWAGHDTPERLDQTAELIDTLARRIEQAIAANDETEQQPTPAQTA